MENDDLKTMEITNMSIPEGLKVEMRKVQLKIFEMASLRIWLRNYPGEKDTTVDVCNKISKSLSKAKTILKEINENYKDEILDNLESAYLNELKEHSDDLFKIKLRIILND